jgi:hypothetical protein
MRKLIFITVVLAATFAAGTAQAGIFGRGNNCGLAVQPGPVAAAPNAAVTARAEDGYRAFSYQPAPAYAAPTYRMTVRQPVTGSGFHDAGWKARGF